MTVRVCRPATAFSDPCPPHQPGPSNTCVLPCLCLFAQALLSAASAAGVSVPPDRSVLTACAIDNLGVLFSRGLTLTDIQRVSYCSVNSSAPPPCLVAPPAPGIHVAPPAQQRAPGNPGDGTAFQSTAFVSVFFTTCGLSLVLLFCVVCLSFSAGASATHDDAASLAMSSVTFSNVSCVARTPWRERLRRGRGTQAAAVGVPIVTGISLTLKCGEFTGVLGPSGSGKSTLLHILAGELVLGATSGRLRASGSVSVDGVRITSRAGLATLRRRVGFVAQDDVLLSTLTVREAVTFSAALRLPPGTAIAPAVNACLAQLDLCRVADSRVGGANAARGVSGGERRRVSIAQELVVTNQRVLCLDEPTSGLDSHTASGLVTTLCALAAEGRAVVASVHQPSAAVFANFSTVLLLAGGKPFWQGRPDEAGPWLERVGLPCPPLMNVADHLLDVACTSPDAGVLMSLQDAAAMRRGDSLTQLACHPCEEGPTPPPQHGRAPSPPPPQLCCSCMRSTARELRVLFRREGQHYARNPALLTTHLGVAAVLSVWLGLVYWRVPPTLAGFQNRTGVIFFSIVSFGFGALSALDLFISDRPLLRKEAFRYFHPSAYYLVKVTMDLVFLRIIPSLVYGCVLYYLIGFQRGAHHFVIFLIGIMLTAVSTSALTVACSMLVSTAGVGTVLLSFLLLQMAIFGGFLSNTAAMPAPVAWLRYLSLFYYSFESLVANELDGIKLTFSVSGFVSVPDVSGRSFLASLNLYASHVPRDLISLACFFVLYLVAAGLLLLLRTPPPGGYFHWGGTGKSKAKAEAEGVKGEGKSVGEGQMQEVELGSAV